MEEERILGGGKKEKVVEPDRQGEREFTNQPESRERNKREEGVVDWKARERKTGRERKRERAGHIEGEHWPGALLRAVPRFSPFFRRLREEGRKREET